MADARPRGGCCVGKMSKAGIAGLALAPFTGGLSAVAAAPDALDALKPHVPDIKPPEETDENAALASERERRRLASGGRPTILSGRRADALSASIGKRTLGGAA